MRLVPLAAAVLLAAATAAPADEVLLKNGRTLRGKVTDGTDSLTLECPGIRMTLLKSEVAEVRRGPTPEEEVAKRREGLKPGDAEAHFRLGLFAASRGLKDEARRLHEAAVKADPDHAGARRELGFVRWEGKWRPEDEVMRERGFVRVRGEWLPKEQAEEAAKAAPAGPRTEEGKRREEERARKKRLNAALRLLASPDAKTRVKGEDSLTAYAKEVGDPALEGRAPEFRAYYDRLFEVLEEQARATIQVRAQLVTLKRPIPTFETSLGGFGTPVRLQLPEVSVISIGTTVVVPLSVDDD